MNEQILKRLVELFSIFSNLKENSDLFVEKKFVESFLSKQIKNQPFEQYLTLFDEYYKQYKKFALYNNFEALNNSLINICKQINRSLPIKQKFVLLFYILKFIKYSISSRSDFSDAIFNLIDLSIQNLVTNINISNEEYENCKQFINGNYYKITDRKNLLLIDNEKNTSIKNIKHIYIENLKNRIFILHIQSAGLLLLMYSGSEKVYLNNLIILPSHTYILHTGSIIKCNNDIAVFYNQIIQIFFEKQVLSKITFTVKEIGFKFRNSENGIHPFSFNATTGEMIGIIGSSGVGKSTLLNILNGKIKPQEGSISINGIDLHRNFKKLKNIIGYIPQDDLLIEEITVYKNLFYNASLCFGNLSKDLINKRVNDILSELDLYDIKDLKVGSPLNKFISGGQRKRLNIALELIREPSILFIDEPTSGLSSSDSLNVMHLLKEQSLKGKILFVNIHQPNSDIYKMFDKLIILDKGGYPVYYGNPIEAFAYFKNVVNRIDISEGECPVCKNINPEELLNIIEEKDVNEFGEYTHERRIKPEEFYRLFKEKCQQNIDIEYCSTDLPESNFIVPRKIKQFGIFSSRNFFTKINDLQFILTALLITPLLAVILGYFSKYVSGTDYDPFKYVFSKNENIPAFLFMSVVVALFVGLIISAEEIIKDRKIIERESFLNLSRQSYLNSKIIFLFLLSAFQTFVFVIISNNILEIKNMTLSFWIILFSTACFSNILGLLISSLLKSVITVYIIVPFLLIPQLLLSGTVIKFDKIHYSLSSQEYVPIVGDIMASRWAYEALLVCQFKYNAFEKNYFDLEMQESQYAYYLKNFIPELKNKIDDCLKFREENNLGKEYRKNLIILNNGLKEINFGLPFNNENINEINFNENKAYEINKFLDYRKEFYSYKLSCIQKKIDSVTVALENDLGGRDKYIKFKQENYNENLAEWVLNSRDLLYIYESKNKLIRKYQPIFHIPSSPFGRSHFLAAYKNIGNMLIDSVIFNIVFIWFMTLLVYLLLVTNILKKLFFNRF
jgi:ABC-type multidrug transport system ATPase subunit